MAVGQNYAFLQFSDSTRSAFDTAGTTITFSTGAQPDSEVRIQNVGTATVWIGMGTRSTSSAAVTTKGIHLPPANNVGCLQIIRTGGNTTLAAFSVGATQSAIIITTGGEGQL